MPIYEYRCDDCRKVTNVRSTAYQPPDSVTCSACGGSHLHRLVGSFAYLRSGTDRLAEFDTGMPRDESFYRDDRNVGLWAKKRIRELGADEETVRSIDEVVEESREKAKDIIKGDVPID